MLHVLRQSFNKDVHEQRKNCLQKNKPVHQRR